MNCENAIMSCENLIMNRENAIVNQLPSEIFLLQSVSFLIKLSCKKLPPSLVKCVFLLQCYPSQVKLSNVNLNFLCLIFEWGEKLVIKIWFYCFQFPRVQILCLSGGIQLASRKVKAKKMLFTVCCWSVDESENGDNDTAATNFSQGRCLSQSTGTLPNFKDLLHKKIVAASSHPRTVLYPVAHPLTNRFYKKFLFVFVCFVSLVFFWSRELNFRQNNAKIQMKRKQNKN